MYRYELEIKENGTIFYETIWADNSREAICDGELKYPNADYVDIA